MDARDYSPQQALDLLLRKLAEAQHDLAADVQAAINQGKDIQEIERIGKKKERRYRKAVPYSDEQALDVARTVLQCWFLEQPLFSNSSYQNLSETFLGEPRRQLFLWEEEPDIRIVPTSEAMQKPLEVELRTETQIRTSVEGTQSETQLLTPVSADLIEEQRKNLALLADLVHFPSKR